MTRGLLAIFLVVAMGPGTSFAKPSKQPPKPAPDPAPVQPAPAPPTNEVRLAIYGFDTGVIKGELDKYGLQLDYSEQAAGLIAPIINSGSSFKLIARTPSEIKALLNRKGKIIDINYDPDSVAANTKLLGATAVIVGRFDQLSFIDRQTDKSLWNLYRGSRREIDVALTVSASVLLANGTTAVTRRRHIEELLAAGESQKVSNTDKESGASSSVAADRLYGSLLDRLLYEVANDLARDLVAASPRVLAAIRGETLGPESEEDIYRSSMNKVLGSVVKIDSAKKLAYVTLARGLNIHSGTQLAIRRIERVDGKDFQLPVGALVCETVNEDSSGENTCVGKFKSNDRKSPPTLGDVIYRLASKKSD